MNCVCLENISLLMIFHRKFKKIDEIYGIKLYRDKICDCTILFRYIECRYKNGITCKNKLGIAFVNNRNSIECTKDFEAHKTRIPRRDQEKSRIRSTIFSCRQLTRQRKNARWTFVTRDTKTLNAMNKSWVRSDDSCTELSFRSKIQFFKNRRRAKISFDFARSK